MPSSSFSSCNTDSTVEEIRETTRIGHVIYAGADQDLEYFRNLFLDRFGDIAESITIYTSRDDIGLVLSRSFKTGIARLGRSMGDLTEADREALRQSATTRFVDVTDATRAAGGGDMWSHAYWYLNPWVSSDVIMQVRNDLAPADRALVHDEEQAVWCFPKDYPQRIRSVVNEPGSAASTSRD